MGRYAEGDYTPRGGGYASGDMGGYDARRGGREPDGYSMVWR